jgi:threonine/homoserine/homoserine lactone efflux protein
MPEMTFLPSLPVFLAFTVAGLILFITPGPDMSLWLARTLTGGRRLGLAAAMGTNLGCVVHAMLAAFGISVLIQASPIAFNTMKVVGALYLLWLAVQMIRHGTVLQVETGGTVPPGVGRSFWTGVAVNLSNPKVVIFFITFLPGFVTAADPHAGAKLLFLGLYFVAMNVVLSAMLVLFADRFVAALRRQPRVLRGIDWLFAGVFAIFAVTILRTQAR